MIKLGANAEKIRVILFGVDTKKFFPEKNKSNISVDEKNTPLLVVSIRDFEPIYNIKSLAQDMVAEEFKKIHANKKK